MDSTIAEAITQGGVVDITTTGRRSGASRRIEIYFHHLDGDLYITGRPGFPRDWMANLTADPRFVLHLKRGVSADLEAVAEIITDPETRSDVLYRILTGAGATHRRRLAPIFRCGSTGRRWSASGSKPSLADRAARVSGFLGSRG